MTVPTLYFAPSTCGRVPLMALEEAGIAFDIHVVAFMAGEHKSPEYLAINPKGKVPALRIDGHSLTENVAILTYLDRRHPDAKLLPARHTDADLAQHLADLSFCAATLHPLVTRIRMSPIFAGPENARAVWEHAATAMDEYFTLIDRRLSEAPWWYGEGWSVMDAYLYWVFYRVAGAAYDVEPFPAFADHAARMARRPAVQRALEREKQAEAYLESRGLLFVPPPPPAGRA